MHNSLSEENSRFTDGKAQQEGHYTAVCTDDDACIACALCAMMCPDCAITVGVTTMAEKSLMKGNEALAEAAIRAGCKCFFGYPITPQTEISAYLSKRMPKVGGVFLQAESEVAAINMVYGWQAPVSDV